MRNIIILSLIITMISCASKEERKKQAEEDGNTLVEEKSSFIKGVGDALKKDGKEAAESVSEGVGEVFNGVNKGFDNSLTKIDVSTADVFKQYIELGRTGKHYNDTTHKTDIIIYAIFKKDLKGKLLLKAFDKEKKELGRKTVEVNKKTDDAEYINFEFDERTPLSLADAYTLEIKN